MRGASPVRQPAQEDRDHAGLAVRILARPVDVRVAQRHVGRPVQAAVRRDVLLGRELRRPVRGERLPRRGLGRGRRALAVDRAAGGGEHDLRPVPPRRLEHADRADRVDLAVAHGILDRRADVGLRGQVEADLRVELRERGVHRGAVAHVALGEGAAAFRFSVRPVDRSSSTSTESPRATSASTRCEPMKPAPPVTRARTAANPTLPQSGTRPYRQTYCARDSESAVAEGSVRPHPVSGHRRRARRRGGAPRRGRRRRAALRRVGRKRGARAGARRGHARTAPVSTLRSATRSRARGSNRSGRRHWTIAPRRSRRSGRRSTGSARRSSRCSARSRPPPAPRARRRSTCACSPAPGRSTTSGSSPARAATASGWRTPPRRSSGSVPATGSCSGKSASAWRGSTARSSTSARRPTGARSTPTSTRDRPCTRPRRPSRSPTRRPCSTWPGSWASRPPTPAGRHRLRSRIRRFPRARSLARAVTGFERELQTPGTSLNRPMSCVRCIYGTIGFASRLPAAVREARVTAATVRAPVDLLVAAGQLIALAVLAAVGVFSLERRKAEATLLNARGTGPGTVSAIAVLEALVPVARGTRPRPRNRLRHDRRARSGRLGRHRGGARGGRERRPARADRAGAARARRGRGLRARVPHAARRTPIVLLPVGAAGARARRLVPLQAPERRRRRRPVGRRLAAERLPAPLPDPRDRRDRRAGGAALRAARPAVARARDADRPRTSPRTGSRRRGASCSCS